MFELFPLTLPHEQMAVLPVAVPDGTTDVTGTNAPNPPPPPK